MYPTAAELHDAFVWTQSQAPSPLARAIAGIAIRTDDLSVAGIRNRTLEQALWSRLHTPEELDRAFVCDRALMLDADYGFEEQVLNALIYIQRTNPVERDPDGSFASNIQRAFSRDHGESICLGAVVVAGLLFSYTFDRSFPAADQDSEGDVLLELPKLRLPIPETISRRLA